MRQSFAVIKPPERFKVRVQAKDRNGAEVDFELQEPTVTQSQAAAKYAVERVREFVPKEGRRLVKPGKDDPEPNEFPQGPETGQIILTEEVVFEITNMYFQQVPEGDIPWNEFVFMRNTAPECYKACQKALFFLSQGEDIEGNPFAGPGLEQSGQQPANISQTTP